MCFSYAINFSASALQTKLQLDNPTDWDISLPWETGGPDKPLVSPGFFLSGFNKPLLPVITAASTGSHPSLYRLSAMHWGLIPHWCKSAEQAQELSTYGLNARAETLHEKPLFRDAWKTQPCVVPVSGFFEWQANGKHKQPHYIHGADQQPLLLAGLFADWMDADTGEQKQTYAIITTEANALMAEIHNVKKRMPVVLPTSQVQVYLWGDSVNRQSLLTPCEDALLQAYPVATWLNQTRINRNLPQALEPIEKDFPQTLF